MKTGLLSSAAAIVLLCGAAHAQNAPAPTPTASSAPTPSENVVVNLIRALEAQGLLSPEKGQALLNQAEAEAAQARTAAGSAPPPGTLRVPYVPESVRTQIRDELKDDVLQTAKAEGWAAPGKTQDWVSKIRIFGDFRYRSEFDLFGRGNANDILDFQTLNANGPTEINPGQPGFAPPLINTTRDRNNRQNIRVRLGVTANIADPVSVTIRLASGDNNSPVSANSTLGGNFTKKNIWLDQAYVSLKPVDGLVLIGGRQNNPFTDTVTTVFDDLVWDPNLNLDGVMADLGSGDRFGEALKVHAIAGAFPLQFGGFNFPTADLNKARSINKWLYAGELIANWRVRHDITIEPSAAFYYFDNVQGVTSDPCQTFLAGTECSSDPYTPAYLQKGNTLFLLRNIVGAPGSVDFSQRQFAGLTFAFHELDLKTNVTVKLDAHRQVTIGGEYVKNLAFRRGDICKAFAGFQGSLTTYRPPLNNVSDNTPACTAAGDNRGFIGGDTAWQAKAQVGWRDINHFGEWNVIAAYKYIESDSMLDSLNNSDFHLGGTNAKGYYIAGTLGLFDGIAGRVRYLSSNQVSGAPLAIDVLQFDLLASF